MKAAKQLPVIGITMGDPAGIGPEIVIKALSNNTLKCQGKYHYADFLLLFFKL